MKNKEQIKQDLLNTGYFEDNEYLDKYCDIVMSRYGLPSIKFKTSRHHIIQVAIYKKWGITDSFIIDNPSNITHILYKDHILAHKYLCLCSIDGDIKLANEVAFFNMINNKKKFKTELTEEDLNKCQELYEDYCVRQSNKLKERPIETIDKIKETKRKHPRVPSEWEKKYKSELMRNKNTWTKGRKDNPETLLKKREMRKDTIYLINNNNEMKMWNKNIPIPSGWRRGFRRKTK
jgi:hypothetical protein